MWWNEVENRDAVIHEKIESYKELISKVDDEINNRKIIKDYLMDSLAETVRQVITPISSNMIIDARRELNKEDFEKKYLSFLEEEMQRIFFDKRPAKIKEIYTNGPSRYSFEIIFEIAGYKIAVIIPHTEIADSDNIANMEYGKYCVNYEKSQRSWVRIGSSYKESEIAKMITDFLDKENNE